MSSFIVGYVVVVVVGLEWWGEDGERNARLLYLIKQISLDVYSCGS
jgi:hypothetical protein